MHRHLRVGGTLEPELQAVASISLSPQSCCQQALDFNKGGSSSALNEGLLERILVTFYSSNDQHLVLSGQGSKWRYNAPPAPESGTAAIEPCIEDICLITAAPIGVGDRFRMAHR